MSVGEKRERVSLKGFFKNKPVRKDESIAIEPLWVLWVGIQEADRVKRTLISSLTSLGINNLYRENNIWAAGANPIGAPENPFEVRPSAWMICRYHTWMSRVCFADGIDSQCTNSGNSHLISWSIIVDRHSDSRCLGKERISSKVKTTHFGVTNIYRPFIFVFNW